MMTALGNRRYGLRMPPAPRCLRNRQPRRSEAEPLWISDSRLGLTRRVWCFDWQRLRDQVLIPLASGAAAQYQRYDWLTGELAPGELHQVARSGVVIVEGVYTARPELARYYNLTVWVDAPREVCMRRLDERGHDHGPGNWNERWRAAEEHYIAASEPGIRLDMSIRGC
jgi:uridine kinase